MADFRDMSIPFTEKEIEQVLGNIRKLPTYDCITDSVGYQVFDQVSLLMREKRTQEQTDAYRDYFIKHHNGRLQVAQFRELMRGIHSAAPHARNFAKMMDLNGDGIISSEEFAEVYGLMSTQFPEIAGKSYADFLEEADTNKDGQVDIDEMVAWIAKITKPKNSVLAEGYRDMSIPFTEKEIEQVLGNMRKLPTYDRFTDSIGYQVLDQLALLMREERTPEQIVAYQNYFIKHHNGRLQIAQFRELMRGLHSTALHARNFAKMMDLNGDGIISNAEFVEVYGLMSVQFPEIAGKTYAEFLKEADTNKDGQVDIDEMVVWIEQITKK